jgi:glutamate dehydrogenase (NAD(P)+)
MGTNQKDIENLYKGAGVSNDYDNDPIDSSYNTAITTFSAVKTLCYSKNLDLRGIRIGIQGLGKVGLNLLKLASEHGLKIVAGSTQHGALYSPKGLDVIKIFDLAKKHGDQFVRYYNCEQKIRLNEFFEKEMEIMCPCAGIYPINKGNIKQINAKIIVPGCNVAASKKIERQLYDRGITYLPGFVSNAGGVIGYVLRRKGIHRKERTEFLTRGIQSRVRNLIEKSKINKCSHAEIARSIARENQKKFAVLSQARMNGRLRMLTVHGKNFGIAQTVLIILWILIEGKYIFPNSVNKYLVKKIVFEYLFKG